MLTILAVIIIMTGHLYRSYATLRFSGSLCREEIKINLLFPFYIPSHISLHSFLQLSILDPIKLCSTLCSHILRYLHLLESHYLIYYQSWFSSSYLPQPFRFFIIFLLLGFSLFTDSMSSIIYFISFIYLLYNKKNNKYQVIYNSNI